MITRRHQKGDAASCAVYSDCESYRYGLDRVWDPAGRQLLFIMLNPSTATETQNDPTIERCERRARMLGFGGFAVANIFGFRATDPRELKRVSDPVGSENDDQLLARFHKADMVLAGWGAHGEHRGRGAEVAAMIRSTGTPLYHLGLTKAGHPRHPLYISYAQDPIAWAD